MSGAPRSWRGSWRSVVVWAIVILVATTVPIAGLSDRLPLSWLDKLVHGGLYLVLGWLAGLALAAAGRRSAGAWIAGIVGLASFAALDEVHQTWIPGRVTSLGDWSADLIGATLGLTAGLLMWRVPGGGPASGAGEIENRGQH